MFDRNQNILLTKNASQTSSNMPATRSNIVEPTNVIVRTCSWGFIRTRFPALGTGDVYLLRALIGSLDCLRLL